MTISARRWLSLLLLTPIAFEAILAFEMPEEANYAVRALFADANILFAYGFVTAHSRERRADFDNSTIWLFLFIPFALFEELRAAYGARRGAKATVAIVAAFAGADVLGRFLGEALATHFG
jgi:hypothetical protein